MNIEQALLGEHSKEWARAISNHIGNNTQRFAVLAKIFFGDNKLLTQRAAWIMSECYDLNPDLFANLIPQLIKHLLKPNHEAVKRHTTRILLTAPIPKKSHALLIELCTKYLLDSNEAIATKANALTILSNMCKLYPELKNETLEIIKMMENNDLTPALLFRVKHAKKQLNKIKQDII